MSKLENQYSIHHILPRSQHGTSESCNIELLKNTHHRAIHTLFDNKMIAEQLIRTVELSEKALREDVRDWLLETLISRDIDDPYQRYKNECIK